MANNGSQMALTTAGHNVISGVTAVLMAVEDQAAQTLRDTRRSFVASRLRDPFSHRRFR